MARSNGETVALAVVGLLVVDQVLTAVFPGRGNPGPDDLPGGLEDTEVPTLTANHLNALAQSLEQALMGGWTEDEDAIYAVFDQVGNRADVFALIGAYGTRCELLGTINCGTLPQALGYYLSRGELDHINAILEAKDIAFKF